MPMYPQDSDPEPCISSVVQIFTRASQQLASSHQALEARVDELNQQVAELGQERIRELTEKERLANRLQQLLKVLPAGVVVLDGSGRVQQCNPAAVQLLGEPLQGARWREVITRAFDPRLDDGHEVSLRDGRRVSVSTQPLGIEPGQIVLLKDNTETRLLMERLSHHQRLSDLGEIAASLAHQIRTPLAAALLYASHLTTGELASTDQRRFAEKVLDRLRHLEKLIQDTLIFAKGGQLGEERVLVTAIVEQLQQAVETQLRGSVASLEVEDAARGAWLQVNRDMLVAALQNLVTNALQSCGPGARLRLETHLAGKDAVDLVIVDDGPGIPPELRERVFEPFFTTRSQGTGLGLAVVKAIARSHQGTVWADSHPGGGCAFTVRLPRVAMPSEVKSCPHREPIHGALYG